MATGLQQLTSAPWWFGAGDCPRVCGMNATDLIATCALQISASGHFDAENTDAVPPAPSGLALKAG
ncbi:hypothetical protein D3C87_1934720 [compost metagenome]